MTSTEHRSPHIIDALHDLDTPLDVEPQLADLDDTPAPPARQIGTLVECFLEGEAPFTVRVANRERIAYEKAAQRHREWPHPTEENPQQGAHFAMTYCAWTAAKRAGHTTLTFDQWCDQLIDWEVVKLEPVDPTR